MGEFIKTKNIGVYTEYKESTPLIILYNTQSFYYYDKRLKDYETNSKDCLDLITGIHECCIINKGKNKNGYPTFQIYISDLAICICNHRLSR